MCSFLSRFGIAYFCSCFSLFFCQHASSATLDDLLSHRAIYDLTLGYADEKTGISGLSGRLVSEFSAAGCEGFAMRFRYVFRIEGEERTPQIIDLQTHLFETADGQLLHIRTRNYTDGVLDRDLEATIRRKEDGILVEMTKPERKTHELPSALFPIGQTLEMLQKAEEGVHFYKTVLYDDFENGDKVTPASVVIGALRSAESDTRPQATGGYEAEFFWPVTVSSFDDGKNPEGLPEYSSHFLIDRHGISRDIVFDYDDFSLKATLVQLNLLEDTPCQD